MNSKLRIHQTFRRLCEIKRQTKFSSKIIQGKMNRLYKFGNVVHVKIQGIYVLEHIFAQNTCGIEKIV